MFHGVLSSHELMHFYFYGFSNAQKHCWMIFRNNNTKIICIYLLSLKVSWNRKDREVEYTSKDRVILMVILASSVVKMFLFVLCYFYFDPPFKVSLPKALKIYLIQFFRFS